MWRMRAIIQRVLSAAVAINGNTHAAIEHGLLVLVGAEANDTRTDVEWMSGKIARLRIFNDENGKMNKSVGDINGEILVVSQFTLFASTRTGNRPSFLAAAAPSLAIPLYEQFVAQLGNDHGRPIKTGVFAAEMQITLVNDGPVTIAIDSHRRE